MRSPCRRLPARVAIAGLVLGAAVAGGTAPATAAGCADGAGVTVVVDDGHTGTTSCATGDPSTGLAALRAAGHRVTMVQQFPGAVCQIDGEPADEACVRMPPQDAYWSYWRAAPGGTWHYSTVGPASSEPTVGSIEGWAFGDGTPPSTPPPLVGGAAGATPQGAASPGGPASRSPGTAALSSSDHSDTANLGPWIGILVVLALGGVGTWVTVRRAQARR